MECRVWLLVLLGQAVVPLLAQGPLNINSFSVEQTKTSVRVTLMFDNVATGLSGCFFDKITFIDTEVIDTAGFTPRYPGACQFNLSASNILTGTMDIFDFADGLQFGYLMSLPNSNIMIRGTSPVDLVTGISVNPTLIPLEPASFTGTSSPPMLVSFDIDWTTNQLLLHFDALIDSRSYSTSNQNGGTFMLSNGSSSVAVATSTPGQALFATTLCISLSATDQTEIQQGNICGSVSSCFCFFPSTLITDYNGNRLVAIPRVQALQASIVRRPVTPSSPVSMRLSLSYLGCNVIHNLMEDEVYVLRSFEYLFKIDCFTDDRMNSSNIRPLISRGSSFSGNPDVSIEEYIGYNWPLNIFLNFTREMSSQLFGQYVCRSSAGYYVRNFIHDNISNIELPEGANYRLPLHDALTISVYFGSSPQVNLTRSEIDISLVLFGTDISIPIDPMLERVNPFHVDIRYNMVQQAIEGNYDLRISEGSRLIASRPITIDITEPIITLLPEVATIVRGQTEIVLQCRTNSPALPVLWTSGNSLVLSNTTSYRENIPLRSRRYFCSVRDPANGDIVANATVVVRDVQGNLSVWQDGVQVKNNSSIEILRPNNDLNLQCFERIESHLADLTWIVLPDNGSLSTPTVGKMGIFTISKSGNQASLSIDNSVEVFRGLIKCVSSSGEIFNVRIVEDSTMVDLVSCNEETDSIWGVLWNETLSGSRDFQPCPVTTGSVTNGVVLRQCHENGVWNDTVDITGCSSESFINLETLAESMIRLRRAYTREELDNSVSQLISALKNITQPKPTTHFPKDLNVAISVLSTLVDLLLEESLPAIHVELADVFDNLLHMNNIDGWNLLTEMNGSQRLLNVSEAYGRYLLESLNSQSRGITISRVNIVYSAMLINQTVQDNIYPDSLTRGAQITIPSNLLNSSTGVVHIIMKSLNEILPRPASALGSVDVRLVVSNIISSQIKTASGYLTSFDSDSSIALQFMTEETARARNPVCLSWNAPMNAWLDVGVETLSIREPGNGEFKVFEISCSSNHLGAFGVAVDVSIASKFRLSIPAYIGCGCVIFSSVLSLFSLLLSCVCDKLRRYSIVALCVHLSFIASVLCAYLTFIAGIEQALDHTVGCAAVAALLQYFFTAAFTWLLCEMLLLVFFSTFSQHCALFLVVFIVGWGIPAIPTAISLGLLRADYGTTTHCWFFFDGQVSNDVVLGFILPKLIIIGVTLFMVIVACIANCKFGNKKIQPYTKANVSKILWFIFSSTLIFLGFLAAAWVFALLLVNDYRQLDSDISGWIFLAASILLSVWMFIFSATLMIVSQRVDYERLWTASDPVYPPIDPGREKGYQFVNMTNVDISGRRTSTLTRPPTTIGM